MSPRPDLTPAERIEHAYRTVLLDAQTDDAIAGFWQRFQTMPPDQQAMWRHRVHDVWFHAPLDLRGGQRLHVATAARKLLDRIDAYQRANTPFPAPLAGPQARRPVPAGPDPAPLKVTVRTITGIGPPVTDVPVQGELL